MAVRVNSGTDKIFKTFSNYTGVSLMKVIMICPTLEEMQAFGYAFKKDPTYLTKGVDGTDKLRVDVFFQNAQSSAKAGFFLENKVRNTKDNPDKCEWINNIGENTWATSLEEALENTYPSGKKCLTNPNGVRQALVGEVEFIKFIRNWCNSNVEDEVTLDMAQLFKGNLKELQQVLTDNNKLGNQIYTLSTVDNNFQQIYTGHFVRQQFTLANAITQFKTHTDKVMKSKYPIKDKFSLAFKEFVPEDVTPDADPAIAADF